MEMRQLLFDIEEIIVNTEDMYGDFPARSCFRFTLEYSNIPDEVPMLQGSKTVRKDSKTAYIIGEQEATSMGKEALWERVKGVLEYYYDAF